MSLARNAERGDLLVVDDNRVNRLLVARTLEQFGHRVAFAENGRLALEMLRSRPADLVLLDIEMPALSGEHVLDLATLFDFLRTTPIVLHSAKSDEELQSLVERSQAKGYIKKTSNAITFVSQVEQFLIAND